MYRQQSEAKQDEWLDKIMQKKTAVKLANDGSVTS